MYSIIDRCKTKILMVQDPDRPAQKKSENATFTQKVDRKSPSLEIECDADWKMTPENLPFVRANDTLWHCLRTSLQYLLTSSNYGLQGSILFVVAFICGIMCISPMTHKPCYSLLVIWCWETTITVVIPESPIMHYLVRYRYMWLRIAAYRKSGSSCA